MKMHADQLALKRHRLQVQCQLQREQVAHLSEQIEQRLAGVDRMIGIVRSVVGRPLILLAATGGLLFIGRWRLLRWASRGLFWFAIAKRMRQFAAR
jgi:hypothetical protein